MSTKTNSLIICKWSIYDSLYLNYNSRKTTEMPLTMPVIQGVGKKNQNTQRIITKRVNSNNNK